MKKRTPLLVAAGIILRGKRILVGQRRKGGRHSLKWEFPGGKVETGESPRQALVRELAEELRIEAKVGAELARYEHEYATGTHVHLLFFLIKEFRGEPDAQVFEQISWVDLSDLGSLDFLAGDLDFIKRLARGDFAGELGF
jgi:8-oxo-dGTP diphosphatase